MITACPGIDYIDELFLYMFAKTRRGMALAVEYRSATNYPPLLIQLHYLVQPWAESQGRLLASDAILDVRRIALLFNVTGVVWIAMLGRRCAGALAGIMGCQPMVPHIRHAEQPHPRHR